MKYSVPILIFCAICASCGSAPGKSTRAAERVPDGLSKQELEEIRRYAEQFQFDKDPDGVIMYPERPSPLVHQVIKRAAEVNEKRHLPYAALFVLRIYHEGMKSYLRFGVMIRYDKQNNEWKFTAMGYRSMDKVPKDD